MVRRNRSWYVVDAVVCTDASEAPALDDEQERRVRLLLLRKELSWCTGSSVRSLLSWTKLSSRPARGARTCWLLLSNGCGR